MLRNRIVDKSDREYKLCHKKVNNWFRYVSRNSTTMSLLPEKPLTSSRFVHNNPKHKGMTHYSFLRKKHTTTNTKTKSNGDDNENGHDHHKLFEQQLLELNEERDFLFGQGTSHPTNDIQRALLLNLIMTMFHLT